MLVAEYDIILWLDLLLINWIHSFFYALIFFYYSLSQLQTNEMMFFFSLPTIEPSHHAEQQHKELASGWPARSPPDAMQETRALF